MKSNLAAAVASFLLLGACDAIRGAPAPEACDDFRIVTYFDNHSMPMVKGDWTGPYTHPLCIVTEKKVARP